jgi:hypothetical protein
MAAIVLCGRGHDTIRRQGNAPAYWLFFVLQSLMAAAILVLGLEALFGISRFLR